MCEIPLETGHHIAAYAYFNISNYKFSLQKELRTKDLSETIPLFSNPALKAHIVLIREVRMVNSCKYFLIIFVWYSFLKISFCCTLIIFF
jgi:hypothetical protein